MQHPIPILVALSLSGCTIFARHDTGRPNASASAGATVGYQTSATLGSTTASPTTETVVSAEDSPARVVANAPRPLIDGMLFEPPRATAAEQCNGMDDDGNGAIDESCGLERGDIQIVLSYDADAEIYMEVESPVAGHRVSSTSNDVELGGRFQRLRETRCEYGSPMDRVDNAYYVGERVRPGTYRVKVRFYSTCGEDLRQADVKLSIAVGGRSIGTYRWVEKHEPFGRNESHAVLEFDVET